MTGETKPFEPFGVPVKVITPVSQSQAPQVTAAAPTKVEAPKAPKPRVEKPKPPAQLKPPKAPKPEKRHKAAPAKPAPHVPQVKGQTKAASTAPAPDPGHGRAKRGFRGDIEGLRAVAVLLVVFNHVTGWPHGGYIGVDIFFVISGYLITGLLVNERERTGTISFKGFYTRRVRRLLPAGILCLIATDIAAHQIFLGLRAHQTYTDSWWSLIFLANYHFASIGTNYFQQTRPPSPFQHYWSLSVEEQFYVVWPLLILLSYTVAKRLRIAGSRMVKLVGALAAIVSVAYCIYATRHNAVAAYFSSPARAWELGLGAVVSMNQARLLKIPAAVRSAVAWVAIAALAFSVIHFDSYTQWPGSAAILPVVATAVLIGAASTTAFGPGSVWALANPLFRYVGKISYSVYLWHWPILVYATALYAPKSTKFYAVAFGLSAVVSIASYHLIEVPGQQLSRASFDVTRRRRDVHHRSNNRAVILAGVVALVLIAVVLKSQSGGGSSPGISALPDSNAGQVAVGATAPAAAPTGTPGSGTPAPGASAGAAVSPALAAEESLVAAALSRSDFPSNLSPSLDDVASAGSPEWFKDGCLVVTAANESRCVYGSATATHHAVLLGDSFAISWMPALRKALPADWDIRSLTLGQCPVADVPVSQNGVHYTECDQHHAFVLAQLAALKPDLVFTSDSYASLANMGDGSLADKTAALTTGFAKSMTAIKALTKHVVTLGAPPGSGNLQSCATRFNSVSACTKIPGQAWISWTQVEQAGAASLGTMYVDTSSWFCLDHQCPAVIGTTPVYTDGDHLTAQMSANLAPVISAALGPLI